MSVDTRFFDGYLGCAIWADLRGDDGEPASTSHSIFDFAKEARDRARQECEDFVARAGDLLADMDMSQAGHDFWLTRNGHGAGFWDRGLGERGQKLTDIAHSFGERYVYIGDDGKLHFD